jgi:hypothetical protein
MSGFDIFGDILGFIGQQQTNSANSANVASTNASNAQSVAATNTANAQNVAETNATNLQIANNANMQSLINQNSAEAYNTQMSNTSYQRGVADLQAAGLNPMLAYTRGGASTPTVTAAPVQIPKMEATHYESSHYDSPNYSSPFSTLATSSRDGKRLVSEVANKDASTTLIKADTDNKVAEKDNIVATKDLIKAQTGESTQKTATGKAQEKLANQQIEASKSDVINKKRQTDSTVNLNTKIGEKEIASAGEIKARENLHKNEAEYGIIAPKIFGGDALKDLDKKITQGIVNSGKKAQVILEAFPDWIENQRQQRIKERQQNGR